MTTSKYDNETGITVRALWDAFREKINEVTSTYEFKKTQFSVSGNSIRFDLVTKAGDPIKGSIAVFRKTGILQYRVSDKDAIYVRSFCALVEIYLKGIFKKGTL